MKQKKNLKVASATFLAAFYALLYMVSSMFSSYLLYHGFDKTTVTTMSSISAVILLFGRPLLSGIIDKGRCRPLAVIYCAAIAAGTVVFFFGGKPSMAKVVCYTLLSSVASSAFMDLSDTWVLKLIKESGSIDYGKARAFGSGSYAVTSLLYGAALTAFGYDIAPYCIFALLAVLLAVSMYMPNPQSQLPQDGKKKGSLSLLRNPGFLVFVVFGTVAGNTLSMLDNFIPVLITEKGGSAFHIGFSSFLMAGIEFFLLRVFTPVADKVGTHRIFAFGIFGFAVKALLVSLMPTPAMIIAACVTQTLSFCIYSPGRMRVLQEEVDQENLAGAFTITSIYSSLCSSFIMNPVSGYLSETIGTAAMMRCFAAVCVLASIGYAVARRSISAAEKAKN
ncbi:MAG: MFS transporter [Oscillospiraceae bacterium]|nr:MFS transporter [Oscillospiraceae bacterium]